MENYKETKLDTKQSVILQTSIQAGQANVLSQKQFARALYEGTGICTCQHSLAPKESVSDTNTYSLVSILTDKPLKVTFVDRQGSIITLICNRVLILDDYIDGLVIVNEGEEDATASITKLK